MFNPAQELSSISFDKIIGGALNAVVSAQNESSLTTVHFIKNVGFENDEKGRAVKPVYVEFKYPKEVSPYQPAIPEYYTIKIKKGGSGYNEETLNSDKCSLFGSGKDSFRLKYTVDSNGTITAVSVVEGELKAGANINAQLSDVADKADIEVVKHEKQDAHDAVYKDMTLQVPLLTIVPIPFIRIASTDLEFNVKINAISNTENTSTTDVKAGLNASVQYRGIVKAGVSISASVAHQKKKSETEQVKKEYSLNVKIHAIQDDMPAGMSRILDILEESIVPKDTAPMQVNDGGTKKPQDK